MKAIDVDKIDWADGCFIDTDGTPLPIHHKIATIEMLRDWQPSCEEEIRADERAKTIDECKKIVMAECTTTCEYPFSPNCVECMTNKMEQLKEQTNV